MKLLTATVTLFALGFGLAQAGPVVDKTTVVVDPRCQCFFPGLQVGGFVSGYLPDTEWGNYQDAIGGGISLTYFFTDNLGLDYSYSVHDTDAEIHINALDLIYRLPLGNSCLAPYFLGGGGVFSNGSNDGAWRLGGGLEYRLANCMAVFADATYNWVDNAPDATHVRLGVRLPF